MLQQRVQSMLGTWRGKFPVVLIVLIVFVSSGYTAAYLVTTHGATSLEITVWRSQHVWNPDVPDVRIFQKTITNLGLVRDVQDQIDGAPEGIGFCTLAPPTYYVYQFHFATGGYSTQTYEGESMCGGWSTTPFGIAGLLTPLDEVFFNETTLHGVEILIALHQQTGMPLPPGDSGWTPNV